MIFAGAAAIDHLAEAVAADDPAASSHWRKYHADFAFTGKGFEGIQGFGGLPRKPTFISSVAHRLLQTPFRAMARRYEAFGRLDELLRSIAASQDRDYDLDILRQGITLAFLMHATGRKQFDTSCVIGDGFAGMTTLLLKSGAARRVVLVNLNKTLLVDLWYLRAAIGESAFESRVRLLTEASAAVGLPPPANGGEVIAIKATDHAILAEFPLDLAINIASMQEMDVDVIAAYFSDLRSSASAGVGKVLFYCCNRESKTLPDGSVIRLADYPWRPKDRAAVDELCPWHQRYYSARPPFYHPYDGPVRHRLVELSAAQS
jgi:hypothetical protein